MDTETEVVVDRFIALARDQMFIRATIQEDERPYDLAHVGIRHTLIDACVLCDRQGDSPITCEIEYRMEEPVQSASQIGNYHPAPRYGIDPPGHFRAMVGNWRGDPCFIPFTRNEAVVVFHCQRGRRLPSTDPVFLQHIARIQSGFARHVNKADPHYQEAKELLFYRLSRFLTEQNRRWREHAGV